MATVFILCSFVGTQSGSGQVARDIDREDWGEFIPGGDACHPQYATSTHAALSEIAARNAECTLIGFLRDQLLMPGELYTECEGPGGSTKSLLEWIRYGSIKEDDLSFPTPRSFYHFYDPTRDRGLTDDVPFDYDSSLVWSFHHADNVWDWESARGYYYDFLSAPNPRDREYACARTFRALGQIVHLIEDAAQPQHTRDDAHGPLEGAPYEEYLGAYYGSADQINAMLGQLVEWDAGSGTYAVNESIPTFTALPDLDANELSLRMMRRYKAFFDTEQYQGQRPFDGFTTTPGMAEFSNFYFVTDDTMFTGDTTVLIGGGITVELPRIDPGSIHYFPYPSVASLWATGLPGNLSYVKLYRSGEDVSSNLEVAYRDFNLEVPTYCTVNVYKWNGNNGSAEGRVGFHYTRHDPNNWDAHAQTLLPRAIAYVSGLFDYFFRGQLDVSVVWDDQQSQFVLNITNRSGRSLRNGRWLLLEDDTAGNRASVPVVDFSGYPGALADGQSFLVTFKRAHADSRPLTLVFVGGLGEEQGSGIAARAFVATN